MGSYGSGGVNVHRPTSLISRLGKSASDAPMFMMYHALVKLSASWIRKSRLYTVM
jgi:hypothetical protein